MLGKDAVVGMRVVCRNNDGYREEVTLGKEYTILGIDPREEGQDRWFFRIVNDHGQQRNCHSRRFEPVVQPVPAPENWQVGDVVRVIKGMAYIEIEDNPGFNGAEMLGWVGRELTISKLNVDDRDNWFFVKEDGEMWYWDKRWCEFVRRPVAVVAPIPKFKVGDSVVVVKKPNNNGQPKWIAEQDKAIGKRRTVREIKETYAVLSDGLCYWFESLELYVPGKKAPVKKKHASLKELIAQSRKDDIPRVGGVSSYVLFVQNKDGRIAVVNQIKDVCHARIENTYSRVKGHIVGVIDYQTNYETAVKKEYHGAYRKWVDWIVNRSPWSLAYQPKTVKNILENGVLMNVECPADIVGAACIALRIMKEQYDSPTLLKTFDMLLKEGISIPAAFLAAYAFKDVGAEGYTLSMMGGGHQPINGGMNAGQLLSFFANGYDESVIEQEPYRENSRYKVFDNILKTKDVLGIKQDFSKWVMENTEKEVVGNGWAVTYKIKLDAIINTANLIEQKINEAWGKA